MALAPLGQPESLPERSSHLATGIKRAMNLAIGHFVAKRLGNSKPVQAAELTAIRASIEDHFEEATAGVTAVDADGGWTTEVSLEQYGMHVAMDMMVDGLAPPKSVSNTSPTPQQGYCVECDHNFHAETETLCGVGIAKATSFAPLLAAMIFLLATPVQAEKFVAVHKNELSGNLYFVDKESFSRSSIRDGVSLKYRLRLETTTLQYSAVAFCDDFSLWNLKVEGVSSAGYTFPVEENYREPVGWIGRVSVTAPLFSEGLGKIIDSACGAVMPDVIDRLLMPPVGDDCNHSDDPFKKAICASRGESRRSINLLKRRTERVAAACGQEAYLKGEFQARMTSLAICGGGELCSRYSLADMMSPISRDFNRLIEWEARSSPQPFPAADVCQAGEKLQKVASEKHAKVEAEAAREQAETDLLQCARSAARRLDDGVTDAKVVANASIKSCLSESRKLMTLYARAEPSIDWPPAAARIEGDVIPFVLEIRAMKRRK